MSRDFLVKECPKTLVRELQDSEQGYSPELWRKMAEVEWMGMVFPEEYGGTGGEFMDLIVLLEEMGRNVVPGPFFSTVVMGGLPILAAGTDDQKKKFLPAIAKGECILSLALTETSATYDAAGIDATASADGDNYSINGKKLFVYDAHVADYILVVTRTSKEADPEAGITIFLVDAKSQGITCTVMPTVARDKQCEVIFENVKVPKSNILGQLDQGWSVITRIKEQANIAKCAEMVGGARATLDMTVAFAKDRVAYGKPIGSYQAIQHYCASMLMDIETAQDITYEVAWMVEEGLPCIKEVAITKAWVSDAYRRVTERGVQIHGAIGTTRDHDVSLYYQQAKAAEVFFGDANYHRELIAQQLAPITR